MNPFFKFLKSKLFLINFGLSLALLFGSLGFVYNYLDKYTMHDESITVPDLIGMNPSKLKEFLADKHLRYEIIDSSVFEPRKPKGAVIDQDPEPNTKVKDNRTIYVSVNKMVPIKVKMPNLVDASYRQAEAILQSSGLKVGELIYKPDMAKNAVLGQERRGRPIAPGTMILQGSLIDLILGDGLSEARIDVPDVTGMTYEEAVNFLRSMMLNEGTLVANSSVKDTLKAVVYKQVPAAGPNNKINQGEGIDLFISQSADTPSKLGGKNE